MFSKLNPSFSTKILKVRLGSRQARVFRTLLVLGMILNRFSKDIGLTDDLLAFTYFEFVFVSLSIIY